MTKAAEPIRSWLLAALVTVASCLPLPATAAEEEEAGTEPDVVILANGHRLVGRIESGDRPDDGRVRITTAHGHMTIPEAMIARLELGWETRRRLLDEEDYAAVLTLARWCVAHKRRDEALELVELALGHPEAEAEAARLRALLTDDALARGQTQGETVLEAYRDYRDRFAGDHAQTIARLDELERTYSEYERAKEAVAAKNREATKAVGDGLEAKPGWGRESPQHFNPSGFAIDLDPEERGVPNKVLRFEYRPGDKHKASLRRQLEVDASLSVSLVFSVFNPGPGTLPLSIALKTGESFEYHESSTQQVPAANTWQELRFDLSASIFRNAATGWSRYVPLSNPGQVRELQIQIHNGRRSGRVLIDNMGFVEG